MKTIDKITISLALMAAFVVGAFLDDAIAQPVTVQKVRYINRPIYQMVRQDAHFREQQQLIAAAIPESLLKPARRK